MLAKTSNLSGMKAISEMGFLRRDKTALPDFLFSSFLKGGGDYPSYINCWEQFGENDRFVRADMNQWLYWFTRNVTGAHVKITEELVW